MRKTVLVPHDIEYFGKYCGEYCSGLSEHRESCVYFGKYILWEERIGKYFGPYNMHPIRACVRCPACVNTTEE